MEPLTPQEAYQMYLNERRDEVSAATLQSHEYRLETFVTWLQDREIDNLNDLSGRDLHQYRIWRQQDGDLAPASLKTQMDTVRVFVRFCERVDGVTPELHAKVKSPSLSEGENERDVMLSEERAEDVLAYLQRYRFASRAHVIVQLIWKTGLRTGSIRAIDVEHFDAEERTVQLEHRPGEDTPLKNGDRAERHVALRPETVDVVQAWIDTNRHDVTDEHGRAPLLTTANGRQSRSSIRETVYRVTRPCEYGDGCPHDRAPENCEATDDHNKQASKCPSSVSPHPVRRGSITAHLLDDVPKPVVSDRCDVTPDVLDKHYDRRSEKEKAEQRRDYL